LQGFVVNENKKMLAILSPAKKLDYKSEPAVKDYTTPDFTDTTVRLIEELQKLSQKEVGDLMSLSDNLASLNKDRFMNWNIPERIDESTKQAAFAFKGDVYQGWEPEGSSKKSIEFAQNHVRILSGLYGVLRPLDLMKPYRLEMGTKFGVDGAENLYQVWSEKITEVLNQQLASLNSQYLINLASNEYSKAVDKKKLNGTVITPEFKDNKNGKYRVISFFAKKARGMMIRFICDNQITDPEQLKLFESDGYFYNDKLSKPNNPVFTRG